MARFAPLLGLLAWTCAVHAALHHILASSKYRNTISALEFDDKTETLSLLKQSSTLTQHSSIAVDVWLPLKTVLFYLLFAVFKEIRACGFRVQQFGSHLQPRERLLSQPKSQCRICTWNRPLYKPKTLPYMFYLMRPGDPLRQPIKSRLISSTFSPNLIYSSVYSDSKQCSIVNWAQPDGTHAENWRSIESNNWRVNKLVMRSDNATMYGLDTARQAVITWRVFRDEPDRVINYNFRESYFDSWLDQTNGSIVDLVASPKQFIAIKDKSNEILTIGVSEEGFAPGHNNNSLDEIMYSGSQKIIADTNGERLTPSPNNQPQMSENALRNYLTRLPTQIPP